MVKYVVTVKGELSFLSGTLIRIQEQNVLPRPIRNEKPPPSRIVLNERSGAANEKDINERLTAE